MHLIQNRWCSEFFTYVHVYWIRNSGPKTKECACIFSCWDGNHFDDNGITQYVAKWSIAQMCPRETKIPRRGILGVSKRGGFVRRVNLNIGNGSGILFREYCFGEENSLSLTEFGANSVSSAKKNWVSSLCHTNNRLRGTHWALSLELGEGQKTHWVRCLKP